MILFFLQIYLLICCFVLQCGGEPAFVSTKLVRSSSKPLFCRNREDPKEAPTYSDLGLLHKVDVKRDKYYTSDLNMQSLDDLNWVMLNKLAWEAAKEDAHNMNVSVQDHVKGLYKSLIEFKESDEIHDREEFFTFLETIYDTKGQLLLVLGGKSVGKSLMLSNFTKTLEGNVQIQPMLVDGRGCSGEPLAVGILEEYKKIFTWKIAGREIKESEVLNFLKEFAKFFSIPRVMDSMKEAASIFFQTVGGGAGKRAEDLLQRLSGGDASEEKASDDEKDFLSTFVIGLIDEVKNERNISAKDALKSFVLFVEFFDKYPVLIVDEANKVLSLGKEKKESEATLDDIVRLTKQRKELSVILTTSEYGYPHILSNSGLNLKDISKIFFTGEIPPASMWDLLVTKKKANGKDPVIGMGENLASVLIASYGGHFLDISNAVEALCEDKDDFSVSQSFKPMTQDIIKCLNAYPRMARKLFVLMAKSGYAPVADYEDETVTMIVERNLAGIISKENSVIAGLPKSIWYGRAESYCVVPTSESARLLMGIFVLMEEKEKRRKEEINGIVKQEEINGIVKQEEKRQKGLWGWISSFFERSNRQTKDQ